MSQLNNHHGHRMYIVCLYTHQIYDTCMMTWMVPRHRTTSSPLSISSPHSPLSLSAKTKKNGKKGKKTLSLRFQREKVEAQREKMLRLRSQGQIQGLWCVVCGVPCAIFFSPLKRVEACWNFRNGFALFCFLFFLGVLVWEAERRRFEGTWNSESDLSEFLDSDWRI